MRFETSGEKSRTVRVKVSKCLVGFPFAVFSASCFLRAVRMVSSSPLCLSGQRRNSKMLFIWFCASTHSKFSISAIIRVTSETLGICCMEFRAGSDLRNRLLFCESNFDCIIFLSALVGMPNFFAKSW